MVSVGLTFNKDHFLHDPLLNGFPSPENPLRLVRIYDYLHDNKLINGNSCQLLDSDPAELSDILRVHSSEYVQDIKQSAETEKKYIGNDVYLCNSSFRVLLQALGCVINAGNMVASGKYDHSFALIRPPGHHASVDSFSGFCIFNNSAILAKYLQEEYDMKRIAIINIDAHASDGTHSIFSDDPSVLCISVHQDPLTSYPSKGFIQEIGFRPALGYNINMEMPPGCGNSEYSIFFDEVVEKVLRQFDPQLVILECGFDAYYKESLSKLNLTVNGYYHIIFKLAKQWNVVSLLEGGYHEDLAVLVEVILSGMQGDQSVVDDVDQIELLASRCANTRKDFNDNLSKLKFILSTYWQLDSLDIING